MRGQCTYNDMRTIEHAAKYICRSLPICMLLIVTASFIKYLYYSTVILLYIKILNAFKERTCCLHTHIFLGKLYLFVN
jgi:hypothetical protein